MVKVGEFCGQILKGANIVTVIFMLLFGYSYLINPLSLSIAAPLGLVYPFFLLVNILFLFFWLIFKKSNALIPFVGIILCYFPNRLLFGINPPAMGKEDGLKVMSYNCLNFHGMDGQELDKTNSPLIQYFIDQDCDILCVQESAINTISGDQKKALFKLYPYYREDTHDGGNRMAIFSKLRIVSYDNIPYESAGNLSMAYKLIDNDGDTILVVNNHLETNHFSKDERERFRTFVHGKMDKRESKQESMSVLGKLIQASIKRAPQAEAVAEYISTHRGMPIIVCGDFNENPISYTHHAIARGLTDCFVSKGIGFGWSYCHHGMRVRIDNILCSEHFAPNACIVDNSIEFSDHYPVVCWLKKQHF